MYALQPTRGRRDQSSKCPISCLQLVHRGGKERNPKGITQTTYSHVQVTFQKQNDPRVQGARDHT